MSEKYYGLKYDLIAKSVLKKKSILAPVLSKILNAPVDVDSIIYTDTELLVNINGKVNRLDVSFIINNDTSSYAVEVNNYKSELIRFCDYAVNNYRKVSLDYPQLDKSTVILITNEAYANDEVISVYELMNKENFNKIDYIRLVIVNYTMYNKVTDKEMYQFLEMFNLEDFDQAAKFEAKIDTELIKGVYEIMNSFNVEESKKAELIRYLEDLEADKRANRIEANKARLEGEETGKVRGIEIGKLEGKLEKQKEIALNLLSLGVDINLIISATGLSEKEILELK